MGVGQPERGHEASDRPATAVRVLLVEDNVVNQRVAIALLERRGHHVTLARNGLEALNVLERNRFDLVLMDLHMPVMGGLEATAEIRTRDRTTGTHTRIVAMTADAMAGDREWCRQAGMDDYLPKPVKCDELFAVVERPLTLERPAMKPERRDMIAHGTGGAA